MTKYKLFAALLNLLVPGLGTAYAGKVRKAATIYVLFLLIALGSGFIAFNYPMFLLLIAVIIGFWIYVLVSAYRDVPKDRRSTPEQFNKGHYYGMAILSHSLIIGFLTGSIYGEVLPVEFAKIPTPSMDPGLKVGDRLAFERTSAIERNDIVMFWVPYDTTTMFAQRCIGMPGDTLRIDSGIVFANNSPLTDLPVKYRYFVETNGPEISPRILNRYHLTEESYAKVDHASYFVFLTAGEADEFRKINGFRTVKQSMAVKGEREPYIFPKDLIAQNWNADFYGPIYIPRQGDEIELSADNLALYLDLIKAENRLVDVTDSRVLINGEPVTRYKFKENYYFIMGDNRHNSLDSRYWGLLRESLVIGKALYVYWSEIPERIGMPMRN